MREISFQNQPMLNMPCGNILKWICLAYGDNETVKERISKMIIHEEVRGPTTNLTPHRRRFVTPTYLHNNDQRDRVNDQGDRA
jgi:hypothetical protein